MKINLTGHHVDVTDSIREHVNEKFSKIANHFPSLIALDIILSKVHNKLQAEISTIYEGARISVKGENEVLYPAISSAAKKLDTSLKHRKGQIKANLHEKPEKQPQKLHTKSSKRWIFVNVFRV